MKVKPAPPRVSMFPRCAPNMASRQRRANGSSVARRPIAADARSMSNGWCRRGKREDKREDKRKPPDTRKARRFEAGRQHRE